MKILISERHLKKILDDPNILEEQNVNPTESGELNALQVAINQKITEQQIAILNRTVIKVTGTANNVQLQIGNKTYPMPKLLDAPDKKLYGIAIPPNKKIEIGQATLQGVRTGKDDTKDIIEEIQGLPGYQSLVQKHPEIQEQIVNARLKVYVTTDEQNTGSFKLLITRKLDSETDKNIAIPFGAKADDPNSDYLLGNFLAGSSTTDKKTKKSKTMRPNKIIYSFKNGAFGIFESNALTIGVSGIALTIDAPVQSQPQGPIQIQTIQLEDLFNYNGVDFKDENTTNRQLYAFVQQVKDAIQKYGQAFIDHMRKQNPTVLGYSSVDGDPNQQIVGEYQPCAGSKTRKDYDLCLSQARAKVIADMLNKSLPELGGIFKFKGLGETTQFGPGWTKESPTIPEQTAPNRRYILTPIKPFVAQPQAPPQVQPQAQAQPKI